MSATWAQLKELRLKLCDPSSSPDIINLETVASVSALPSPSAAQTAYRLEDVSEYHVYVSALAAWERLDLLLSDSRLSALIDSFGEEAAVPEAIHLILANIGQKIGRLKGMSGGAESVEYQSLMDAYNFYKGLARTFADKAEATEGTSTGLYMRSHHVSVAGGMHG